MLTEHSNVACLSLVNKGESIKHHHFFPSIQGSFSFNQISATEPQKHAITDNISNGWDARFILINSSLSYSYYFKYLAIKNNNPPTKHWSAVSAAMFSCKCSSHAIKLCMALWSPRIDTYRYIWINLYIWMHLYIWIHFIHKTNNIVANLTLQVTWLNLRLSRNLEIKILTRINAHTTTFTLPGYRMKLWICCTHTYTHICTPTSHTVL